MHFKRYLAVFEYLNQYLSVRWMFKVPLVIQPTTVIRRNCAYVVIWVGYVLRSAVHSCRRPFYIFLFSLCTLSILVSLSWLSWLSPFVLTVQHTRHKRPCPRRDTNSNPSKRAATDLRLISRGDWHWHCSRTSNYATDGSFRTLCVALFINDPISGRCLPVAQMFRSLDAV